MSFDHIIGQRKAVGFLQAALRSGRVPHAYLFAGPAGVGKSAVARELARALLCLDAGAPGEVCGACAACRKACAGTHPDLLWVGFAYQAALLGEPEEKQKALKIDTLRAAEKALRLKPLEGRIKMAVVDPADKMGDDAANALLKILEEPPPKTHLVLLALDSRQILPTLRSRCQEVRFSPLSVEAVSSELLKKGRASSMEEALLLARRAQGSLGHALSLLENGESQGYDWEKEPLSGLLSWTESFRGKEGRENAAGFLTDLLHRTEGRLSSGESSPEEAAKIMKALETLRQNVSPQLVVEVLLLDLRRKARKASA